VCVCAECGQGGYAYVWEGGVGEWVCMYVYEGRVGMCVFVRGVFILTTVMHVTAVFILTTVVHVTTVSTECDVVVYTCNCTDSHNNVHVLHIQCTYMHCTVHTLYVHVLYVKCMYMYILTCCVYCIPSGGGGIKCPLTPLLLA